MTRRQCRSNSVPLIWGQASQSNPPTISARGTPKIASAWLLKAVKRQSRSTAKKLSPIPSRSASTRESLVCVALSRAHSSIHRDAMLRADYSGPILHRIIRLNELNRDIFAENFPDDRSRGDVRPWARQPERNRLSRLQVLSVAAEMRQYASRQGEPRPKRTIKPLYRRSLRANDGGSVSHSSSVIIPRRQATERGCVHRRHGAGSAALRAFQNGAEATAWANHAHDNTTGIFSASVRSPSRGLGRTRTWKITGGSLRSSKPGPSELREARVSSDTYQL